MVVLPESASEQQNCWVIRWVKRWTSRLLRQGSLLACQTREGCRLPEQIWNKIAMLTKTAMAITEDSTQCLYVSLVTDYDGRQHDVARTLPGLWQSESLP